MASDDSKIEKNQPNAEDADRAAPERIPGIINDLFPDTGPAPSASDDPPDDQSPSETTPASPEVLSTVFSQIGSDDAGAPSPRDTVPAEAPASASAATPKDLRADLTPGSLAIEDEETDVWWGGYSSLHLLPSWLVCLGLTAVVLCISLAYLQEELIRPVVGSLLAAIWGFQLFRWGYRFFGYNYRLTTRKIYVDKGNLYDPPKAIALADIQAVNIRSRWWQQVLDIGDVEVVGGDPPTTLKLTGVRRPVHVAKLIRNAIDASRRLRPAQNE